MTEKQLQNQVKVGLIATGDELTQGDILNSNGREIAATLHELGFLVNQHIIVDDNQNNICAAIQFQAKQHDIVILSGGLGPTSDDRTRFALAQALDLTLIFNDNAWAQIVARLNTFNLKADEHNRQQALLLENATMLPNSNGTAAGSYIEKNGVTYIMLPGPPSECLPMFHLQVIPLLKTKALPHHHFKWLLMGASEGETAAKLDDALNEINCCTGYRWAYPYLEFKVYADNKTSLQQAEKIAEPIIQKFLVSKDSIDYQQQLIQQLKKQNAKIYFSGDKLSQYVQAALLSNHTQSYISDSASGDVLKITVTGLDEYWKRQKPPLQTEVCITLSYGDSKNENQHKIYFRDDKVLAHVVAVTCKQLLSYFSAL